ncbi:MAG: hypothetical protein A2297_08480 [Elusimicrobia bacterium RIFOXYB2_FULL_48_7]|nr:MAG: hypothetical protein A2297_08480 [Elusimicrobia bacterium RIFOXYB2_FULL_48_7]
MKRKTKFIKLVILTILLQPVIPAPALFLYSQETVKEMILQEIKVKEGDTLWSVSNFYLKDPQAWPEILKYNKLPSSDPNVILPGMALKVPVLLVKESLRPAHLIYLQNDVRFRKKNDVNWDKATPNMELFNEDGLRTMEKSEANIRFLTGEVVRLDENSFVILRPEKKREEVEIYSGAVRASKTKIIAEDVVIDPKIEPRSGEADFKTRVKPDKTTLVEVYNGVVDVTAQNKTVTLTKGFGTQIKYKEAPDLPRELPPLPEFELEAGKKANLGKGNVPENAGKDNVSLGGENLNLSLKAPEIKGQGQSKVINSSIKKYHLQVAKDQEFKNIILDETNDLKDTRGRLDVDLSKKNLPEGRYCYRISYLDDLGFESRYSIARLFTIDTTPPVVDLQKPLENEETTDDFIGVEGKAEQGVVLQINDKTVIPDESGRFITALTARKGKNAITIIAKDPAGNITRLERTVYRVTALSRKKMASSSKSGDSERSFFAPGGILVSIATIIVILGVLVLMFKH